VCVWMGEKEDAKRAEKAARKAAKRAAEELASKEGAPPAEKSRAPVDSSVSDKPADKCDGKAAEIERLRERVAPAQEKILQLLDARPKQPGTIPGSELAAMYEQRFGEELNPLALTGQVELKSMLNRRNIFPSLGVRGSEKLKDVHASGWIVYRVLPKVTSPTGAWITASAPLLQVQENIIELLRRFANPIDGSEPHHSIDAGALPNKYGFAFKRRFNFRDFGCQSMREFVNRCPKLAVTMRGPQQNQMCICVAGTEEAARLLPVSVAPPRLSAAASSGADEEAGRGTRPHSSASSGSSLPPSLAPEPADASAARPSPGCETATPEEAVSTAEAKLARKAAKKAAKAAAAGLTEAEAEAAAAHAKQRRVEKKALGKAKKLEWLEEHGRKRRKRA